MRPTICRQSFCNQQVEAAKLDAAIAKNLRDLGYDV